MDNKPFYLKVQDRDQVVFEGEVLSVTSKNDKGIFDILPNHANFISLLNQNIKITKVDGSTQEVNLDNGVVKALGNKVEIFLGIKK